MDFNDIKDLIELLNTSNLSAMEIQEGDFKIRLEKSEQGVQNVQGTSVNQNGFSASKNSSSRKSASRDSEDVDVEGVEDKDSSDVEEVTKKVENYKVIKAPMVGAYHSLPDVNVEPGMKLKKGDKVCIIEAMKLMNEVTMEEDGEIVSMEAQEGGMVEYGQVLVKYK